MVIDTITGEARVPLVAPQHVWHTAGLLIVWRVTLGFRNHHGVSHRWFLFWHSKSRGHYIWCVEGAQDTRYSAPAGFGGQLAVSCLDVPSWELAAQFCEHFTQNRRFSAGLKCSKCSKPPQHDHVTTIDRCRRLHRHWLQPRRAPCHLEGPVAIQRGSRGTASRSRVHCSRHGGSVCYAGTGKPRGNAAHSRRQAGSSAACVSVGPEGGQQEGALGDQHRSPSRRVCGSFDYREGGRSGCTGPDFREG